MVRGASMNEEVNRVEENGERETQNKPQRGRKRTRNEDNWTRNIKKRLKNSGKPYISSRGKEMAGKAIKVACSEKCTLKCSTKFSEEERKSIFEDFWASGDKREQHHFLLRHAEELPAKRMRVGCGKRSSTFHYYFYDAKKATRLEVCRAFFINTLDIKRELVYKVLRRQSTTGGLKPSCQGKHGKQKRIGEASLQGVRDHINSFPLVESHYCRARTERKYLDPFLSVASMYRLYSDQCDKNGWEKVSEDKHRKMAGNVRNLNVDDSGEKTSWSKVREVTAIHDDPSALHIKTSYEGQPRRLDMNRRKRLSGGAGETSESKWACLNLASKR
ncbi:hypothetical protein RRG08_063728 [Elysia crispata]|uniref:Uncharacterized protein n=1 Tax=Elysia crispata TaxID=231223 RepID=A0AAE0ZVJ4_9GAST|nr:hypothetical protein RRG08_063728 [Elysia crispata]